MPCKLSILICHLPSRVHYLDRLLQVLRPQLRPDVNIRIDGGEGSVGAKRNRLLQAATGLYSAFVDDDDLVSMDYVERILRASSQGFDCCSLTGEITVDGGVPRTFSHSMKHGPEWREENGVYLRPPNHLNAVRSEIAKQVTFPDSSFGEDHRWSTRLWPLLQTEAETGPEPLYFYEFRSQK